MTCNSRKTLGVVAISTVDEKIELSLELLVGDGDADPMLGGVVGVGEGRWPEVLTLGLGAKDASGKLPLMSTLGAAVSEKVPAPEA
jgi:hypothetical protein